MKEYLPIILPRGWKMTEEREDGAAYEHDAISGKKVVILSVAEEQDGKKWVHASISRKNRLPDYNDLVEMKNIFIGPNRKAVQIFAPMSEHVDIHKYCLHLWACLDGDPFPDFTQGGKTI